MTTKTMTLLDARYWLESAVKAKGASVGAVGIEATVAEIDIVLDDHQYKISIRPIKNDYDDCA